MTVLSRGAGSRRGGRRPGWLLLTVLLVLAIAASAALVFTSRVELLKLAVILALWAAVLGAFVSVIYRRQSDADQAKVRDLKLVYDLQLEREISARREYELTVESHLRRELASELRAEQADEVEMLRAELAALRRNLEILFDADLGHRPALETERGYAEWAGGGEPPRPDRVSSSRITAGTGDRYGEPDDDARTAESRIIDVPEEPLAPHPAPASPRRQAAGGYRGSHRRASEETTYIPPVRAHGEPPHGHWAPERPPAAPQEPPRPERPPEGWQPVETAGQWIPAGQPGSNWSAAPAEPGRAEPRGRHSHPAEPTPPERHGRHSASADHAGAPAPPPVPPRPHTPPPAPHAPPAMGVPEPPEPAGPAEPGRAARHRSPDEDGPATGGQSVAELLARLQQTGSSGGGRRRRRAD